MYITKITNHPVFMLYLIIKSALSGIIIMLVSEIAKRNPSLGGMVASLPLVSVLGIIWLWKETENIENIAKHSEATFWFVLPSLPMFLIFPAMLRYGLNFWIALLITCFITIFLYSAMLWLLPKIGVSV